MIVFTKELESSPAFKTDVYNHAIAIKSHTVVIDDVIMAELIEKHRPSFTAKLTHYMASNFKMAKRVITRQSLFVSDEERARRLAICQTPCRYFESVNFECRHSSCGCDVRRKSIRSVEVCPIGRW